MEDNWALLYAQQLANHGNPNSKKSNPEKQDALPLAVVFNMVPTFLNATKRHYAFMLKGLKVVEAQLKALNIPFFMLEVGVTQLFFNYFFSAPFRCECK